MRRTGEAAPRYEFRPLPLLRSLAACRPLLLHSANSARRASPLPDFLPDSKSVPFHGLIRRLDLRLRILRLVRDLGFAAAAVALALLAPRLFGDGLPWLPVLIAAGGAGFLLVRFFTGGSFDRAAAAGDRGGGLRDELASAQWFSRAPSRTEWEEYQIARARQSADGLEARELLPLRAPRKTLAAVAALAGLTVVLSFTEGPLVPDSLRERLAAGFSGSSENGGPLEADRDPGEDAEDAADARVEARSPEEILAELRAGELRLPEDSAADGDALQAALAAAMEERAFEETSEEVSAALAGLAEAMDAAGPADASEWLDGLSEAMRTAQSSEELQALLESLEAGAETDAFAAAAAEMMELMESGMTAEEAFQQLAENLQAMDGQQGSAPGEGQAQQMPFPGDGEGSGQPQAGEGGEPAGGMPQGAAGLSGQVQMMAAEGQMGAPIPMDAGPAGDMTGPGGGGASEVLGASTSLEVQLEMEAIPPPAEQEPAPEQTIERQSRREDATVAYDSVRSLSEYAEEAVFRNRSIPTGLRPLVRAYFLMIRETAAGSESKGETAEGAEYP